MTSDDKYLIPMVHRAGKIINYIYNRKKPVSLSEISSDLNLSKTTVYRLLYTLKKSGFIEQNEDEEYGLGLAFVVYGSYIQSNLDIRNIAKPYMKELSNITGESVNLGVYYNETVVTIENVKGEDFYLVSRLIPVSPLNCSSMGKIYLSEYDNKSLEEYFASNKPEKRTINSIINIDEFMLIKDNIKKNNLAYDYEEYEYGLTCIARSLKNKNGEIVAAISLSGPTTRLNFKGLETMEASIKKIATSLEEDINKYLFI